MDLFKINIFLPDHSSFLCFRTLYFINPEKEEAIFTKKQEDVTCNEYIFLFYGFHLFHCLSGSPGSVPESDKMIALHDLEIFHDPWIQRLYFLSEGFPLELRQLHHRLLSVDQRP